MPLPWFKMYWEFSKDPKIQTLPIPWRFAFVMLLCWHAEGELDKVPDRVKAKIFEMTVEELGEMKEIFTDLGFIEDGWTPKNWEKRQSRVTTPYERLKKHREKKRADRLAAVQSPNDNNDNADDNADVITPLSMITRDNASVLISNSNSNSIQRIKSDNVISVINDNDVITTALSHTTNSPMAATVIAKAKERWEEIDIDAEIQANELIRSWGAELAGQALDKTFRKLGKTQKPWNYANSICQSGLDPVAEKSKKTSEPTPNYIQAPKDFDFYGPNRKKKT